MANPPPKILKLNILLRSQYFAKNPKGKPNIWIWHLYFRFLEPQGWSGMSSTTPLSKVEDRSVLTRRIDTYKNVVFTKIASNYIIWSYNNSEQSSRLTCPPQIQLKSRRTGAVLTRRMDTYNEVVFTKVASNHTTWWNHSKLFSRLPCLRKIQLESRRTGAVLTRRMATYNEVVFTKVASNHTTWWHNHSKLLSRLPCPPKIQFHQSLGSCSISMEGQILV